MASGMVERTSAIPNLLRRLPHFGAGIAPYLLLEIFAPGGTVLTLLLYLRRRRLAAAQPQHESLIAESSTPGLSLAGRGFGH